MAVQSGNSDIQPRRYSAFISYTDADRALAAHLQARLERYRLPRKIAEQIGSPRIRPVFVDRSEMSAASDLGAALTDALRQSDYLIVLCTPRTPKSRWVGQEINAFRELRGSGNILVALFQGDKERSFHPNLLINKDDHETEPLAADFRQEGDGYRNALLKLLASIVGVNLDELIHRDAKRQRRLQLAFGGLAAAIVLVFSGLAFWGFQASNAVDQERIQASQAMERQLEDLRAEIRAGGTLDMAAAVVRNVELFYDGQPPSRDLPEIEFGRARLLHAKVEDAEKRGDFEGAAAEAQAAWKVSKDVLDRQGDNPEAIYTHAQSAYWVGFIAWRMRDTPLAANAFARYADLADRLVAIDPDNAEWRLEQGYAYSNLGVLALREALDTDLAEQYFSAAQEAFREVGRRDPDNLDVIYEIADGEAWLADVGLARGDIATARTHREEQRRLVDRLLREEPRNLLYLADDLRAKLGMAALEAAQNRHRNAVGQLRDALEDARSLLAADPSNATIAGQLRAIELFIAASELDLAARDRRGIIRAEDLLGSCSDDWDEVSGDELAVFCHILESRISVMRGNRERARAIMTQPKVIAAMRSPLLGSRWNLKLDEQCARIGVSGLCP